jgi:cyanophycin synthetase
MDNHIVPALQVESGSEHIWKADPISLAESRFFAGCNIYHTRSVLRQRVYLRGKAKENGGRASPELKAAFMRRFLELPRFAPTYGDTSELRKRLSSRDDIGIADILMEAVLMVEAAVAVSARKFDPVKFAQVEEDVDHIDLIWETSSVKLSRRAADVALGGVLEVLDNQTMATGVKRPKFEHSLAVLLKNATQDRPRSTVALISFVAQQKGLPVKILSQKYLRIGQGRSQRHLESAMTEGTSAVAHGFCWDKRLAVKRMAELGVPVPKHMNVASVDAAHKACDKLGFPIVIKPFMGNGGKGVTSGIQGHDEVEAAFVRARRVSNVLVEEYIPGSLYRLSVIGGEFAGALVFPPPMVVGDGEKTIRELIEELNTDPLRNDIILTKFKYDGEAETFLKRQGLTLDSVLAKGETSQLRKVANLSNGAVSEDCTDRVHQDNRELAERAARGFNLEVAGIDLITPDISRSYRDVGGRIIELNTRPGLLMHMWPARGTSRNLAAKILDRLYPSCEDARIPIVVVAGDRGTGTVSHILDRLLRRCGKSTGLSLREAAYVNGKAVDVSAEKGRLAPTALLSDPELEVLVSAISLRRVVQRGMDLDSCSVAIILDRNKEGNAEQFHAGVSVIERATAEAFVVGVGNQMALQHLEALGKRRVILVGNRITDPLAQQHLARGGTVIADGWADEDDRIVLMKGERHIAHFPANKAWARLTKGQQRKMRRVTKYAIAAASGIGIPLAEIEAVMTNLHIA